MEGGSSTHHVSVPQNHQKTWAVVKYAGSLEVVPVNSQEHDHDDNVEEFSHNGICSSSPSLNIP